MRFNYILQALSESEKDILQFYGEEITYETLGLIHDLFNAGISMRVSIRTAFGSLKKDMMLDDNGKG